MKELYKLRNMSFKKHEYLARTGGLQSKKYDSRKLLVLDCVGRNLWRTMEFIFWRAQGGTIMNSGIAESISGEKEGKTTRFGWSRHTLHMP